MSLETPPDTIMVSSDAAADKTPDGDQITVEAPAGGNSSVPKPKRLACMICRKRKLKCDGIKPSCSTCSRLGHTCAYDEVRRKSGPKRGYVKALEERLSTPTTRPPAAAPGRMRGAAREESANSPRVQSKSRRCSRPRRCRRRARMAARGCPSRPTAAARSR